MVQAGRRSIHSSASNPFVPTMGMGGDNSLAGSPDDPGLLGATADEGTDAGPSCLELLRTISSHGDVVNCVAWSPDGRRLCSASNDRSVRVWDAATGAELLAFLAEDMKQVYACAWAPDGAWIATGGYDNRVRCAAASARRPARPPAPRLPRLPPRSLQRRSSTAVVLREKAAPRCRPALSGGQAKSTGSPQPRDVHP